MKIRIKDNSIRFRLTRSEVETLSKEGAFESHTTVGTQNLRYRVQAHSKVPALDAKLYPLAVTLLVNKQLATHWSTNDTVGHYHQLTNPDGSTLDLLLEKDFVCMDETVEDQSDNYPNPKMMQ